jgi:hypothetical protein
MPCQLCHIAMRYLGIDRAGYQYFECHQDGCERQDKLVRRWWEGGTEFRVEDVE